MNEPVKLIVAKNHQLLREAFVSQLRTYAFINVIGVAGNRAETLELLQSKAPDILILDIEMPLISGETTAWEVKRKFPEVKIILLGMFSESYYMLAFFRTGINGYLTKDCTMEEVIKAITTVHQEGKYINEKLANRISGAGPPKNNMGEEWLDEVKVKVLKLICKGKRGKEIADELRISIDTLNFHKRIIKNKTGYDSTAQLVVYAIKQGIVPLKEI